MTSFLRSSILAVTFAVASVWATRPSFAADPGAPAPAADAALPPYEPTLDPMYVTGGVDLAIGGTLLIASAFAEDEPPFGTLAGAGLGSIAAGLPMLAAGAWKVTYARRSEGTFAAGSALASFGATASGAALGYVVGDVLQRRRLGREVEPDANNGWYLGPGIVGGVGVALGVVGATLMVVGGAEKSAEERSRDEAERREIEARERRNAGPVMVPRSVGRRTAGQVLVGLGGATLTGAIATGIAFSDAEGFGVIMHFVTTIPLASSSLILNAVGIPLWVSGAQEVPASEVAQAERDGAWMPEVGIGAGNVTVTTRF